MFVCVFRVTVSSLWQRNTIKVSIFAKSLLNSLSCKLWRSREPQWWHCNAQTLLNFYLLLNARFRVAARGAFAPAKAVGFQIFSTREQTKRSFWIILGYIDCFFLFCIKSDNFFIPFRRDWGRACTTRSKPIPSSPPPPLYQLHGLIFGKVKLTLVKPFCTGSDLAGTNSINTLAVACFVYSFQRVRIYNFVFNKEFAQLEFYSQKGLPSCTIGWSFMYLC